MTDPIAINITAPKGLTQGLKAYVESLKDVDISGGKIDANEWDATIHELANIQAERLAGKNPSIFSGGSENGSEKGHWHNNMIVQEGQVQFSEAEMGRLLATMGVTKKAVTPPEIKKDEVKNPVTPDADPKLKNPAPPVADPNKKETPVPKDTNPAGTNPSGAGENINPDPNKKEVPIVKNDPPANQDKPVKISDLNADQIKKLPNGQPILWADKNANGNLASGTIVKDPKGNNLVALEALEGHIVKDGKTIMGQKTFSVGKDGKLDKLMQTKDGNGNTVDYTYDNGKMASEVDKDAKGNQTKKREYKKENEQDIQLIYGKDPTFYKEKISYNKDNRIATDESYNEYGMLKETDTYIYKAANQPGASVTTDANNIIKQYNPSVNNVDNLMKFVPANNGTLLTMTKGDKTYKLKSGITAPDNTLGDIKNLSFLTDMNNWEEVKTSTSTSTSATQPTQLNKNKDNEFVQIADLSAKKIKRLHDGQKVILSDKDSPRFTVGIKQGNNLILNTDGNLTKSTFTIGSDGKPDKLIKKEFSNRSVVTYTYDEQGHQTSHPENS